MLRSALRLLIRLLWKVSLRLGGTTNVATAEDIRASGQKMRMMREGHQEHPRPRLAIHLDRTVPGALPAERPRPPAYKVLYDLEDANPSACPAVHRADQLGLVFRLPYDVTFLPDRTCRVESPHFDSSSIKLEDLVRRLGPAYLLNLGYRFSCSDEQVDLLFTAPFHASAPAIRIWNGIVENPSRARWVGKGDVIQAVVEVLPFEGAELRLARGTPILQVIPLVQYELRVLD